MKEAEKKEKLKQLFLKNNAIMTTAQLTKAKVYYGDIQKLLEDDLIEKVKRGYYHWIDETNGSEMVILHRLFPEAVFCMETALFYYGYSDRNPAQWHFSLPKDIAKQRTKIEYPFIKAYRMEPRLLQLGRETGEIDFVQIQIFDRDRTICDVLRHRNGMDREIFNKAIQNYVKDPKKNIGNLMIYGKELRVLKIVKDLIGVWL